MSNAQREIGQKRLQRALVQFVVRVACAETVAVENLRHSLSALIDQLHLFPADLKVRGALEEQVFQAIGSGGVKVKPIRSVAESMLLTRELLLEAATQGLARSKRPKAG